jgi:16S rRNA (guanine(527)-N(7))-methyltransferase RsmG
VTLPRILEEVAAVYGIRGGSAEAGQLGDFLGLLEKWNRRMNLTASTRAEDLAPLVEESLWAAQAYRRRKPGERPWRHLDIGTGSGFPAIPLKIVNPFIHLTLLESREKKAFFLEQVVRDLHLDAVQIRCRRLSEHLRVAEAAVGWDTVSWKAIRLPTPDWERLLERSARGTEFWVFHGGELPVASPEEFRRSAGSEESLRIPRRQKSYLSIFHIFK